uniref:Uncharacterized protein n=1 Tax=Stegastes partitus TaxID=144197 RepID=A0A3B5AFF4_9TELE
TEFSHFSLKETLVTVQQLDKNMSNLRTWLSRIEAELAKPLVYDVCHSDEIQRKLAEQQVGGKSTASEGSYRVRLSSVLGNWTFC